MIFFAVASPTPGGASRRSCWVAEVHVELGLRWPVARGEGERPPLRAARTRPPVLNALHCCSPENRDLILAGVKVYLVRQRPFSTSRSDSWLRSPPPRSCCWRLRSASGKSTRPSALPQFQRSALQPDREDVSGNRRPPSSIARRPLPVSRNAAPLPLGAGGGLQADRRRRSGGAAVVGCGEPGARPGHVCAGAAALFRPGRPGRSRARRCRARQRADGPQHPDRLTTPFPPDGGVSPLVEGRERRRHPLPTARGFRRRSRPSDEALCRGRSCGLPVWEAYRRGPRLAARRKAVDRGGPGALPEVLLRFSRAAGPPRAPRGPHGGRRPRRLSL